MTSPIDNNSYTVNLDVDLDGDDQPEIITIITDDPRDLDLDGNGEISEVELRIGLEDGFTRNVNVQLSGSDVSFDFTLIGGATGAIVGQAPPASILLPTEAEVEADAEDDEEVEPESIAIPASFVNAVAGAVNDVEEEQWGEVIGPYDAGSFPAISQLASDSENRASNCGPTALLMVLQGFGIDVDGDDNAARIDTLAGEIGTSADGSQYNHIERVAAAYGLDVVELLGPRTFNANPASSVNEIITVTMNALAAGDPVMMSVSFLSVMDAMGVDLSDAERANATTHYIVITGYEDGNFIINDPWSGRTFEVPRAALEEAVADFESVVQDTAGITGYNQFVVMSFSDDGDGVGSIVDSAGNDLTGTAGR